VKGIHASTFETAEIEDNAAIARSEARNAVTAAPHGKGQAFLSGEIHALDHIRNVGTLNHKLRPAVDHRVVHPACGIVGLVGRADRFPAQVRNECFNSALMT
jgi:hypothetical protein